MSDPDPGWGLGTCAVCGRKVAAGMLMCRPHWQQVPRALQRDVYAALDSWYGGGIDLEALRTVQRRAVDLVAV